MPDVPDDMYQNDIAFAVCCLAQFCEQPLNPHLVSVKRILRYIAGTRNQGITFGLSEDLKPIGYTDSDWGGCRETRKSTSGYVFMIAGGPVCWRSKKQSIVATSSCEAEYIASCSAAKEAVWLSVSLESYAITPSRSQFEFLRIIRDPSTQERIKLSLSATKHVDIQYHYVRNVVTLGKVEFVPADKADDRTASNLCQPPFHDQQTFLALIQEEVHL